MNKTPTATQATLLQVAGVTDGDALWNLLKDDGGSQAMARVNGLAQTAFWNLESAEDRYAEALAGMIAQAQREIDSLAAGTRTTSTWTSQAADLAVKAQAEMAQEIAQFRQALSIRRALLAEQD